MLDNFVEETTFRAAQQQEISTSSLSTHEEKQ
jgi:hypothetical protein